MLPRAARVLYPLPVSGPSRPGALTESIMVGQGPCKDKISVTQDPSSEIRQQMPSQEETQIQDPQLRVPQPTWPRWSAHY